MKNRNFILIAETLIIITLCHSNPVIAGYDEIDSENNSISTVSIKQISSKEKECFEEQPSQSASKSINSHIVSLEQGIQENSVTSTKNFITSAHKSAPIIHEALESFASVGRTMSNFHLNLFFLLFFTFFQNVACQDQGNGHGGK